MCDGIWIQQASLCPSEPSSAAQNASSTPESGSSSIPEPTCLCSSIYEPVCGDDGQTYSNSCRAMCANLAEGSWTRGECGKKPPSPVKPTEFCGHIFDCVDIGSPANHNKQGVPSCGWCQLGTESGQGMGLLCLEGTLGNCSASKACAGNWVHDASLCPSGYPVLTTAVPTPHETSRDESPCLCSSIYDPVCDADNRTHSNSCWARCSGLSEANWTQGQCGKKPTPMAISAGPCGHVRECMHIEGPANHNKQGVQTCGWCQFGNHAVQGLGLPCLEEEGIGQCSPREACAGSWVPNPSLCHAVNKDTTTHNQEADNTTTASNATLLDPSDNVFIQKPTIDEANGTAAVLLQNTGCTCQAEEDKLVCGQDGKTYRSRCEAACKGAAVVAEGDCFSALLGDRPKDHWRAACLRYCKMMYGWLPSGGVCSNDGVTYSSECAARCYSAPIAFRLPCACQCTDDGRVVSHERRIVETNSR